MDPTTDQQQAPQQLPYCVPCHEVPQRNIVLDIVLGVVVGVVVRSAITMWFDRRKK